MIDTIMYVMEILGTIAFAVSGSLVAVSCSLDIFGVILIGCITATGGGILRDVLLGRFPASLFLNVEIFVISAVTSIIVFIIAYIYRNKFQTLYLLVENINNIFDAIGLAAFSVTGTEIACSLGYSDNLFLVITMGMLTGIGGGIFRDVLTDTTPFVLKKRIYALASFAGSFLYYMVKLTFSNTVSATATAVIVVVMIRLLAARYRWKLPRIKFE